MADDFKAGDVVVRISDNYGLMPVGTIRRVAATFWYDEPGCEGEALEFVGDKPGESWFSKGFRKLPPASPEFIALLRSLSPGRVKEDA